MSKCLNSRETCTTDMGDIDVSKDVTILENTVRRLARELGVALKGTSGISYARALEGRKGDIVMEYQHDFDGYEAFDAYRNGARFAISKVGGEYLIDLQNSGKNLLDKVNGPESPIEKRINLRILANDIRDAPEEIHEPIIDIKESELNLITGRTILKYLS